VSPALLWRLARADLLERTRRTSFLVALLFMMVGGWHFLPAVAAGYVTINLDGYRGLYNSAWVGASMALLTSTFLSLVGFYLVRGTIDRDRRTGVGEILATTPLSRFAYLGARAIGNFVYLALLTLVILVTAVVMQQVRGEVRSVDPVALALPFALVTLPLMALVAAMAVFADATKPLSGTLGNVGWFFFWIAALIAPATLENISSGSAPPALADPTGFGLLISQMIDGARAHAPDFNGDHITIGVNITEERLETFPWDGIRWTGAAILGRLAWFGVAAFVVTASVPFFDRFAQGATGPARFRRRKAAVATAAAPDAPVAIDVATAAATTFRADRLSPVSAAPGGPGLLRLVRAELKLLLFGVNRWWYVGAALLLILGAVLPAEGRAIVGGIGWIWPLGLWSALGCREALHGTAPLLDSAPRPVTTRLLAQWLAGLALGFVAGGGGLVAALLGGRLLEAGAVLVGAGFVSALALAGGVLSGSRRLFEAVYLLFWYIGPMNRVPALDFSGGAPGAAESGAPVAFAVAAAGLLAMAMAARRRAQATA
jgi:hypothetical protein